MNMKLQSSNKFLEEAFAWAVDKTAAFVVTGTKNGDINKGEGNKWYGPDGKTIKSPTEPWAEPKDYKPCFWAGYFDRTAYYIRDFVHQASGAYYVGLEEEIFNMYYTFVSNASAKTGWFAPWAFNFDGSVYYMDTPNYKSFVREISAQFELCEKAYSLYLLTGDKRYAEDDVIFNFIEKTMTVFIDNLDGTVLKEKNGIPEGKGDIFEISATYNERGFNAAEAGDSIAAMYQAILSYANILKIRGNQKEAEKQFSRAEELKEYFNNEWSVVDGSDMYAYAIDNKGRKHYKWEKKGTEIHGGETLKFIPMKGITYPGERNERLLDYIHECELNIETREDNIESLTYLPDLFFRHNRSEEAWHWMKHIISQKDLPHEHKSQGTNGDYPEISFTFISQVIEGLMGISVNAATGEITASPCLPEEIEDIKLYDFRFGEYTVDIFIEKDKTDIKKKR
ncbi:MAG: hypothetical protein IJ491_02220 [Clostridia bacterium]|nr:hypothetical protein [Clostridia bacterium]